MKTKWEYLCENLTKEGDIIDKYGAYQACPFCSSESTEVEHPDYQYGDEPQLEDVEGDHEMWTLGCPDCGFEITYETTTVAKFVKIPEQIPEHLDGLAWDFVSDDTDYAALLSQHIEDNMPALADELSTGEPMSRTPEEVRDILDKHKPKGDPPQDDEFDFEVNGWRFSRETGWEHPR